MELCLAAKVGEIMLWCACAFALIDLATLVPRRFDVDDERSVRVLVSVLAVLVTAVMARNHVAKGRRLTNGMIR